SSPNTASPSRSKLRSRMSIRRSTRIPRSPRLSPRRPPPRATRRSTSEAAPRRRPCFRFPTRSVPPTGFFVLGAGDDFELRSYVLGGLEIAEVAAAAAVVQDPPSSALLEGGAGLGAGAVWRRRRQGSNIERGAIVRLRRGFAITFVRGMDPRPGAAW